MIQSFHGQYIFARSVTHRQNTLIKVCINKTFYSWSITSIYSQFRPLDVSIRLFLMFSAPLHAALTPKSIRLTKPQLVCSQIISKVSTVQTSGNHSPTDRVLHRLTFGFTTLHSLYLFIDKRES